MYRIESDEERIRKVGEGNFDDSYFDSWGKEIIEDAHDICPYCYEPMEAVDQIARKGRIIMTCDTDDCPGNMALDSKDWNKKYSDLKRAEDRELVWDLSQIALNRPYQKKLWATKHRLI